MKTKSTNKTKILLIGVAVAFISLASSLDIIDTRALDLLISDTTQEQGVDLLEMNNKLKLEKLAISRKLVKETSQKVENEHNTMVN